MTEKKMKQLNRDITIREFKAKNPTVTQKLIAQRFGISQQQVNRILSNANRTRSVA